MKKVTLLAASVLAATMAAPAANAYTPNAYFGGYLRSGVSNHHTMKDDPQVQHVGRLGYENDTYGEVILGTDIAQVDDTVWSVQTRFTMKEAYNRDWQPVQNGDPEKTIFANREAYISVKGLLDWDKDAEIWAGKRYVREDVHITDVYWFNISGMGAGINNLQVGPGKASVAWMRRDDTAEYKWDNDVAVAKLGKDVKLANMSSTNILDARYQFGLWDGANLEARGTFFIPKRDDHEGVKKFQSARDEYKGGQAYYLALGQGFSNGWNKTVLKYAHGSIANYGAFGNDQWLDRSGASDKAYRWSIYNFGDLKLTDRFGIFHLVYGTVSGGFDNNYDHLNNEGKHDCDKKNDKAFQIVVRPYYQLTKMTRLYAEAGFYVESTKSLKVDKDNNCWGDTATKTAQGQKYTVAYAITPDASNFWSRPEIRIYASYVHGNANGQDFSTYGSTGGEITFNDGTTKSYSGSNTHDFLFGVMAEAWW